jgi:hypothetical protein
MINAINAKWTGGYFSYVFTLAEPPSGTQYKSMVGDVSDRRPLFVVRVFDNFNNNNNNNSFSLSSFLPNYVQLYYRMRSGSFLRV